MKDRRTPNTRSAFTIVELLVAMALIIFIMYILAEAFAAGTTAFRNLKAIGDMNERLRSTGTTLRRYLQADHFEGRKRLSDADFWKDGPPQEGFFRIIQSPTPIDPTKTSIPEGNDLDLLPSSRTSTHAMHFTAKLRGNNRGDYFRAGVPGGSPLLALPYADSRFQETALMSGVNVICSSVGEIAIYLRDTGLTTEDVDNPGSSPQPLFSMHLRQRLMTPDNDLITAAGGVASTAYLDYLEISATKNPVNTNALYFNNLQDLTIPGRRWGLPNAASDVSSTSPANYIAANSYPRLADENPSLAGNDVLLTDVLSCHISVLLPKAAYAPNQDDFVELSNATAQAYRNPTSVFGAGPNPPVVFDTWSSRKDDYYDYNPTPNAWQSSIPMYRHTGNGSLIGIRAIKITLRIWDSRTKQTRQSSIVVDM